MLKICIIYDSKQENHFPQYICKIEKFKHFYPGINELGNLCEVFFAFKLFFFLSISRSWFYKYPSTPTAMPTEDM